MTCCQKICAFIEAYCLIPEGAQVGTQIKLMTPATQERALREHCKNGWPIKKASQLLTVKREGTRFWRKGWLPQPLTKASLNLTIYGKHNVRAQSSDRYLKCQSVTWRNKFKLLMICLIFVQHLWCRHYRFRTACLSSRSQTDLQS